MLDHTAIAPIRVAFKSGSGPKSLQLVPQRSHLLDAPVQVGDLAIEHLCHVAAWTLVPVAEGSLAEWTAAATAFGINLRGREAQFVDNACNAVTTSAEVKASKICQEAKAEVVDPRRVS